MSFPSDFLEDSVKEHTAHWRKGEEALAKWLKEQNDSGGFIIEGKGKGRSTKQKGQEGGSTVKVKKHTPSEPSNSKEEAAS